MNKNALRIFEIICILIVGFILSASLVMSFFTILNAGNPYNSGDLAGFVLMFFITPILWLPVSFVLYLLLPLDKPRQVFYKTFFITGLSVVLTFIFDFLLRRSF